MGRCQRKGSSGQSQETAFPDGSWLGLLPGFQLTKALLGFAPRPGDITPWPLGDGGAPASHLPWEPPPRLTDECGGVRWKTISLTSYPGRGGRGGRTQKNVLSGNQGFLGQVLGVVTTPPLVPSSPAPGTEFPVCQALITA